MTRPTADAIPADLCAAAFDEVRVLHVLIEDWFNARLPATALDTLLQRFDKDFSMVGIAGRRVDRAALATFFAAAHGSRAGLRIAVEQLTCSVLPGDTCVVRYREDQTDAQGAGSARQALAVLVPGRDGGLQWYALHETAIGG